MKLLNYTLLYFSIALLVLIGIWASIFYINMLDEVYDSIDDGLGNYKTLIIQKAETDPSLLHKTDFAEGNYFVNEITPSEALNIRDVYSDTTMFMQNEQDFEPVRMLTTAFVTHEGQYYELKVISSMVEEDDLIEDLLYSLIWLYLAMMLSILALNNLLLKHIWRPFYHLLEKLKNYRLGKEEVFTPTPTKIKEFKDLNAVVTSMMQRNLDTYRSQKQFIENASHELQTPIAISLNKLELLAERQELSEEAMHTVGNIIQTLERLTRLNRSLLMLSKIENQQYEAEEPIDFNVMTVYLMEQLQDLADFKAVTVKHNNEGTFTRIMNRDLAEILLSNLIKNAILHNVEGGEVTITTSANYITISNTGNPQPLDAAQAFNRFYKSSTEHTSTGLGLAIVKAVAERYGLTVTYRFVDSRHEFVIS